MLSRAPRDIFLSLCLLKVVLGMCVMNQSLQDPMFRSSIMLETERKLLIAAM